VERDPLQDVKALEAVRFVMKGGQIYRNDYTSSDLRQSILAAAEKCPGPPGPNVERMEVAMCPACIGTIVLIAAGTTSTGGVAALIAKKLRARHPGPQYHQRK